MKQVKHLLPCTLVIIAAACRSYIDPLPTSTLSIFEQVTIPTDADCMTTALEDVDSLSLFSVESNGEDAVIVYVRVPEGLPHNYPYHSPFGQGVRTVLLSETAEDGRTQLEARAVWTGDEETSKFESWVQEEVLPQLVSRVLERCSPPSDDVPLVPL